MSEKITKHQMVSYGYTYEKMIPVTKDEAIELFNCNTTVYMLYPDDTEAMVSRVEEINEFGGMFGTESGVRV